MERLFSNKKIDKARQDIKGYCSTCDTACHTSCEFTCYIRCASSCTSSCTNTCSGANHIML